MLLRWDVACKRAGKGGFPRWAIDARVAVGGSRRGLVWQAGTSLPLIQTSRLAFGTVLGHADVLQSVWPHNEAAAVESGFGGARRR